MRREVAVCPLQPVINAQNPFNFTLTDFSNEMMDFTGSSRWDGEEGGPGCRYGRSWTRGFFLAGKLGRDPPAPLPPPSTSSRPLGLGAAQGVCCGIGLGEGEEEPSRSHSGSRGDGDSPARPFVAGAPTREARPRRAGVPASTPGEAVGASLPPSAPRPGGPGHAGHSETGAGPCEFTAGLKERETHTAPRTQVPSL